MVYNDSVRFFEIKKIKTGFIIPVCIKNFTVTGGVTC